MSREQDPSPSRIDDLLSAADGERCATPEGTPEREFQVILFRVAGRQLAVPIDEVDRTERIPAITPVPGDAGFRSTLAALNLTSTGCGIVPLTIGTCTMDFLAFSIPLRIASGTSRALPTPMPTLPR